LVEGIYKWLYIKKSQKPGGVPELGFASCPSPLMLWGGAFPVSFLRRSQFNSMDALSALVRLAPYGLAPAIGAYGAYRGARSIGKNRTSRRVKRIPRSLTVKGLHQFKRSVNFNMGYSPLNGVTGPAGGTSNSLSMNFSLQTVSILVGAVRSAQVIPNFAELTALFDKWRLKSVTVSVFFQDNSSSTGVTATNIPLVNYIWDSSDNTIETLDQMSQHPNVKRYQFGNGAARNGCLKTRGVPLAHITGAGINGGTVVTGTRPEKAGTWFDTATPDVAHNCLKMTFDPIGGTQVANEGSFSYYVDLMYELKDVI